MEEEESVLDPELLAHVEACKGKPYYEGLRRALPKFATAEVDLSYGGPTDRFNNSVTHPLDAEGLATIGRLLTRNRCVRRLLLCYNVAVDSSALEGLRLEENENLELLSLYGTNVTTTTPLVRAVETTNNSLVDVDLRECRVTKTEALKLHWALQLNRQPLRLKMNLSRLASNAIGELTLDDAISSRACDDTTVRLIVSTLLGVPAHEAPPPLPSGARSLNHALTSLSLPNNAITSDGASVLAAYLPLDTALKSLNLAANPLGPAGCEALAQGLVPPVGNSTLTLLNLSSVRAGDAGGQALARIVQDNETLVSVYFRDNEFRKCGGAFVRAHHINTTLQVLDLQGNYLSDEHLEAIASKTMLQFATGVVRKAVPMLHANKVLLHTLDCTGNEGDPVTDVSLGLLVEAMAKNTSLKHLDLGGNPITEEGLRKLCTALAGGAAAGLVTLGLSDMQLSPQNAQETERGTHPAAVVARMVAARPGIESIDLSGNYLEPDATQTFFEMARGSTGLVRLGVERTAVAERDRRWLSMLLQCNAVYPPVRRIGWAIHEGGIPGGLLDFSVGGEWCQGYGPFEGVEPCQLLVDLLDDCHDVTALDLSGHHLGNDGVLPVINKLRERWDGVKLNGVGLGESGAQQLCEVMQQRGGIVLAEIEDNPAVPTLLTEAIDSQLRFNSIPVHLKDLLNRIETTLTNKGTLPPIVYSRTPPDEAMVDDWVPYLVSAIVTPYQTTGGFGEGLVPGIDLSHNPISDTGVLALSQLVRHPATRGMTFLRLSNTMLTGPRAIDALFSAAKGNPSLTSIDLSHNVLATPACEAIIKGLQEADSVVQVNVVGCPGVEKDRRLWGKIEAALALNDHPECKAVLRRVKAGDVGVTEVCERQATTSLVDAIVDVLMEAPHVHTLRLEHGTVDCKGAGSLARLLQEGSPLTELSLAHNAVRNNGARLLASAIEHTTTLRSLDLSWNCLEVPGAQALIKALNVNTSLCTLELRGNPKLPSLMLDFVKHALINDQPYLKSVLPRLRAGEDITSLDFSPTPANSTTAVLLAETLLNNITVTHLNLSHGRFGGEALQHFARFLAVSLHLEELIFDDTALDSEGCSILASAVKENAKLRHLSLKDNNIDDRGVAALASAVSGDGSSYALKEVLLAGNPAATGRPLRDLTYALEVNRCPITLKWLLPKVTTLTKIVLTPSSPIDERHGDGTALKLAGVLPRCTVLRVLDLSRNEIGEEGGSALAEVVPSIPSLAVLDLSHNKIAGGGVSFQEALEKSSTVLTIRLEGNGIASTTVETIELLCEANSFPVAVKRLILRWLRGEAVVSIAISGEDDDGCLTPREETDVPAVHERIDDYIIERVFCRFLKGDEVVQEISLCHGGIESTGIRKLCKVLASHPVIRHLDFTANNIDDLGGFAMVQLVSHNQNIHDVGLAMNLLTDSTAIQLQGVVKCCSWIKDVDLSGNEGVSMLRLEELNVLLTLNSKCTEYREIMLRLLAHDPTLHTLDLSGGESRGLFDSLNDFDSSDGLSLMLQVLCRSAVVHTVDLSFNSIRNVDAVAGYCRTSQAITNLTLSHNYLSPEGLLSAVCYSTTLKTVRLVECGLTESILADLLVLLEDVRVLELLDLRENLLATPVVSAVGDYYSTLRPRGTLNAVLLHPPHTSVTQDSEVLRWCGGYVQVDPNEPAEVAQLREQHWERVAEEYNGHR